MEKDKIGAAERADMEAMEAQARAEGGEDTEPEDLVLRFGKPYKFGGMNPALQEMSLTFCTYLAQRVAKLPLEFFTGLPAKEAIKLKTLVTNFLYGGDGED